MINSKAKLLEGFIKSVNDWRDRQLLKKILWDKIKRFFSFNKSCDKHGCVYNIINSWVSNKAPAIEYIKKCVFCGHEYHGFIEL